MNVQSFILLAIVVVAFVFALYRFISKQRRGGSCGGCSCNCNCDNCHR